MKISYNWLKQYISTDLPAGKIAELLTFCGLEVSGIEKFQPVKGGLEGLIIGEVKTKGQHPNADRLSLTTVDIGNGTILKIVCGAPNVAAGQKVVVAPVGTTLFPISGEEIKIKKSKIRGEESEGMICAEDEMGLSASHEGIMVLEESAPVGLPAREYFKIEEDQVFEVELTPNRVDAASHIGVARDLAAVLSVQDSGFRIQDSGNDIQKPENNKAFHNVRYPSVENFTRDNTSGKMEVIVENIQACPRYSGLTITNVTVKESPEWLKARLLSIGQKPINNIVDITNFVLHETGQPLHAFDADQIAGNKVIVKTLSAGTKFITLDGKERELHGDDLMICNGKEGMCIAGVFGGIKSGVTDKTKTIFLESAHFNSTSIRKTAKRHDLHTEASFRFERGSDVNSTLYALKRAALLIKELAGGEISSEIIDIYPTEIKNSIVALEYEYCDRLTGKKIARATIKTILQALEIKVVSDKEDKLILSVPSYRVDVQRPADIVEEMLRIYGYNNVEIPRQVRISLNNFSKPEKNKVQNNIADFLSSNGFREIMSNSLSRSEYYKNNATWKEEQAVKILNPLSAELDVLRQTLLFNGLEVIQYNQNRKNENLKLYEFGTVYSASAPISAYREEPHLALFLTGNKHPENWNKPGEMADFYTLKEFVENVLHHLGIFKTEELPASQPYFKYGLSCRSGKKSLVEFGEVGTEELKIFDLRHPVFYADFYWANVYELIKQNKIKYEELPKFPSVRRDLAMILDKKIQYGKVERIARQAEKNLLKEVNLFDVFEDAKGIKIPAGKKSYAVAFTFLDKNKTLTDVQVDKMMARLMETFEKELDAQIRK